MNTKGKWYVMGDDTFFTAMNSIANFFLVINTYFYQVIDLGLKTFLSNDVFDKTIGKVFTVATTLYDNLFSALGVVLFLVAIAIIFFVFAFKSPVGAIKSLFTLFLVIGLNSVIYINGEDYMRDINTVTDEVELTMLKAVSLPVTGLDGEEVTLNASDSKSSSDMIRETYFNMVMKQTFAMVNFGTAEFKDEYKDYLYTEEESKGDKAEEKSKKIDELVVDASKDNYYLTPDSMFDKIVISMYGLINNAFVGGVLLVLAVAKFVLKLVLLSMVFILPIVSILSIIPQFASSLLSALGKILAVFCFGAFLTLGLFLFYFIMMLVDSTVIGLTGGATVISCILALIVKIIIIVLIWKNQDKIISFVTGGKVISTKVPKIPNMPLSPQSMTFPPYPFPPELPKGGGNGEGEGDDLPNDDLPNLDRDITDTPDLTEDDGNMSTLSPEFERYEEGLDDEGIDDEFDSDIPQNEFTDDVPESDLIVEDEDNNFENDVPESDLIVEDEDNNFENDVPESDLLVGSDIPENELVDDVSNIDDEFNVVLPDDELEVIIPEIEDEIGVSMPDDELGVTSTDEPIQDISSNPSEENNHSLHNQTTTEEQLVLNQTVQEDIQIEHNEFYQELEALRYES